MRTVLIHVRDPQFYAYPTKKLSPRGVPQIIGFPPIGIMSLSAVLKRQGHECTMFDQADPDTPNQHIVDNFLENDLLLIAVQFNSGMTVCH